MRKSIETVLGLAQMSPGFADPDNRADFKRAKPLIAGAYGLLTAAQALLDRWGKGNLSEPMQALHAATKAITADTPPAFPANVRRFYDISTFHLDEESRRFLDNPDGLSVTSTEHGWLVYVPDEDAVTKPPVPGVIVNILDRVRTFGCDYVWFDADALEDPELPTFEDVVALSAPANCATLDEESKLPSFYASRESAAWKEAWDALIAEFGDPVCLSADSCESWQYLGTLAKPDGTWKHCFRHRALPPTGQRTYREYPATKPAS